MINEEELQKIMKELKGEDNGKLYNFYKMIFHDIPKDERVILLDQTSISLVEMYISANSKSEKINTDNFYTESSLLSESEKIYNELTDLTFKNINIVCTSTMDGDLFNDFFNKLLDKIIYHAQKDKSHKNIDVKEYLMDSIKFRLYTRSSIKLGVSQGLQKCLMMENSKEKKILHHFNSNIDYITKRAQTNKITFIPEINIEEQMAKEIELKGFKKFKKFNNNNLNQEQTIMVHEKTEPEKFIMLLRLLQHSNDKYSLMPFIILPKLSKESYSILVNKALRAFGVNEQNLGESLKFELANLYLSLSLLYGVEELKNYDIKQNIESLTSEINFGKFIDNFEEKVKNTNNFLDHNELIKMLDEITKDSENIFDGKANRNGVKIPDRDLIVNTEDVISDMIRDKIIYDNSERDGASLRNKIKKPSKHNDIVKILNMLNEKTNYKYSYELILSQFINLVDEGYISIKVDENESTKNIYEQCINIEDLAAHIKPIRYNDFLGVFSEIKIMSMHNIGRCLNMTETFLRGCEIEENTEELLKFIKDLYEMKYAFADWRYSALTKRKKYKNDNLQNYLEYKYFK